MAKTDLHLSTDDYVPVADRIRLFYQRFPSGRIISRLVRRTHREVVVRAAVFRSVSETKPAATGWAAEREGDGDINTVACLENTETSAIGRALANLGLAASANRSGLEPPDYGHSRSARTPSAIGPNAGDATLKPDAKLQRRADQIAEALTLLRRAEQLGLSPEKARVFRDRLGRPDNGRRTVYRIARRLRDWLHRRFARVLDQL